MSDPRPLKAAPESLDPDRRGKFIRAIEDTTNEVLPYESNVISAVLGTEHGKSSWRFRKGLHCTSCKRELRVLDYFLASLNHHAPSFIRQEIEIKSDRGRSSIRDDGYRIELVDHPLSIPCLACGTIYTSNSY